VLPHFLGHRVVVCPAWMAWERAPWEMGRGSRMHSCAQATPEELQALKWRFSVEDTRHCKFNLVLSCFSPKMLCRPWVSSWQ